MAKKINTRIQNKIDTPANWNTTSTTNGTKGNFVPLKGELIVYSSDVEPKLKVGDGSTTAYNLPFMMSESNRIISYLTVPTISGSYTYSGSEITPSWINYDSTKMTLGGTYKATNAGSYTATFTPKGDNVWSDGSTTAKNVSWSIQKGYPFDNAIMPNSINLNSVETTAYPTLMDTRVSINSVSSTNTAVATVTKQSNTQVKITYVGNGTATINVTTGATTNLNAKTYSLSVTCSQPSLENLTWQQIYNYATAGTLTNYVSIGDTKTITNFPTPTYSTVTYPSTIKVILAHVEGSRAFFIGFKDAVNSDCNTFYDRVAMSAPITNNDGSYWPSTLLHNTTCQGFATALVSAGVSDTLMCDPDPTDSSTCKVTIPSVYNIKGSYTSTSGIGPSFEQIYFEYFEDGNTQYKHNTSNSDMTYNGIWLRNFEWATPGSLPYTYIHYVSTSNGITTAIYSATYGFAPVFAIGTNS